jgi:O-antigen/teichoic acid export membrane protein
MGIVIRQSIFTSLVSYVGAAIGYVNLLYLYPKFMEPDQIGLLRTILDAALLLAPFAQVGLAQSIIRFYPQFARDRDQGQDFISFILLLSLCGYGLFLLIFFVFENDILSFFKDNASIVADYISLILWLTFIVMVITLMEFYSRSLMKIVFPNFLREVGLRLMQGILVSLYFVKVLSFYQLLVASVLIYLVSLITLVLYLAMHGHIRFRFRFRSIPTPKVREILTYSTLSLVSTGSMIIIGKLDSLMVTGLAGLASNAIYTTAFYMATVIEIPKRAITQSAATLIAKAFDQNDMDQIKSIYRKAALNQFIVGGLLMIGIWANLDNLFQLMPKGDIFQAGTYVVIWIGLAKLLDMSFGPNGEIIVLSKYYWFNMITLIILAAMVIIANYIFIPVYGLTGAAYSTAISLALFNLVKWIFVHFKLGLQPFSPAFLKVFIIIVVVASLNLILPKIGSVYLDIGYRSIIIAVAYIALILLTKSSTEVNKTFRTAWQWLMRRNSK